MMWEAETPCARSEGVITPPCHGGDRRFKSGRARHRKYPSHDGYFLWRYCHLLTLRLVATLYKIPIDDIPPGFDVVIPFVFVVQIIRVLPDIET